MHAFRSKLTLLCSMLLAPFASAAVPDASLHLPLTFEQNGGQAPAPYRFTTRHGGVPAAFRQDGVDFSVTSANGSPHLLRMEFPGAAGSVQLVGQQPLPGVANYLKGAASAAWHTQLPTYGEVLFQGLYPGIDLIFHGDVRQQELEHDFVLHPGSDPASVRFTLEGADRTALAGNGELIVTVGGRHILFHAPKAWQTSSQGRHAVPARFAQLSPGVFGFRLGAFDHHAELTIDPVLAFATYFDGSSADTINAITTDTAGNIYIAGQTASIDLPTVNPQQSASGGNLDAFIAKLDPTGHTLLYSTYLGGSGNDSAQSIAIDGSGNIAVSGDSLSHDFPSAGKLSATVPSGNVTYNFLSSLAADGSSLRYSGFVGTTSYSSNLYPERLNEVAFDTTGAVYMAGLVQSDFPYTQGAYGGPPAEYPAAETLFVAKVLADGTVSYGATIPQQPPTEDTSTNHSIDLGAMEVDANGQVSLSGTAGSHLPTTAGVVGSAFPGSGPAATAGFALKLNAAGSALIFSTYLPGTNTARGITSDSSGNLFIVGASAQTNLPASANAFQSQLSQVTQCNCSAGYVYKLSNDGKTTLAATYYGNPQPVSPSGGYVYNSTELRDVVLDGNGNVVVDGTTTGSVPLKNPLTAEYANVYVGGGQILVALRLSADLSTLQFGTYLNAPAQDNLANAYAANIGGLALTAQNQLLVAGTTNSTLFPTTPGAFQSTPPVTGTGNSSSVPHQFVAAIDLSTPAGTACYASSSVNLPTQYVGTTGNTSIAVTNCGNASLTLPALTSSDPTVAASHNCNGIAPGDSCQIQLAFTPPAATNYGGFISVAGSATLWPQKLAFQGAGGYPQVFIPSSLAAPDALLGQTTYAYLVLFNTGSAPFSLQAASATGDFQVESNDCGTALATNAVCNVVIRFTPTATGTRTGTLTLTDNLTPSTQTVQLTGQSLTSAPAPTISDIPLVLQPASGDGLVVVNGDSFFPNSVVVWNGQPLTTYSGGEQQLSATVPANLLHVGEATVMVNTPAPGGGTSNTAVATVYGELNVQVLHEVYSSATGLLYATTGPNSPLAPNSLVAIDPLRLQVTATLLTGNAPDQLAVSDDGTLLYVGLDTPGAVAQIALPSGKVNATVALPIGQATATEPKSTAIALAVLPGAPHTWIVAFCGTVGTPCGAGEAIFDDAVQRPTIAYELDVPATSFAFTTDLTGVYALYADVSAQQISHLTISSAGLTKVETQRDNSLSFAAPVFSDGQQLFLDDGEVLDPLTLTTAFTYPVSGSAFTLDVPNHELFYVTETSSNFALTVVDKNTKATLGKLPLPNLTKVLDLQRFSTRGMIVQTPTNLFFFQSSLVSTAAPPSQLMVSPSTLTFPAQIQGTTSTPQTLIVTNDGSSPVSISSLAVTGDFAQTSTCVGTLASGGTCTVTLTYTPTVTGAATGQLTIQNSATPASLGVTLNGTGLPAPTYTATLTPATLTFASQLLGTSSPGQTLTLNNTGTGTLTLSGITVTGDFQQQTTTCGATLAAGASCTVVVGFKPSAAGARMGSLTVTEKESSVAQTAALSGLGMAPLTYTAGVSPGTLTFGTQDVGSGSSAQTVTLQNTGTASLTLSGISVSGDFAQSNSCGNTLTSGGSCSINVTFTPTATGTRTGTLTVSDDASAGPQTVTLTGNADLPLTLSSGTPGGTAVTVNSGATASYSLTLTPGAYSGPVALSCSGAPVNATCAVTPASLTVSGGKAQPFTVSVSTQTTVQAVMNSFRIHKPQLAALGFLGLLALPLRLRQRRGLRRSIMLGLLLSLCSVVGLVGCGGGSSPGPTSPTAQKVAPGTYTLTVTAAGGNFSTTQSLTLNVQ